MADDTAILAAQWSTLKDARGVSATYHRGENSVAVTLVPAQAQYEVDESTTEGKQTLLRSKRRDWIVAAADLVLAGLTVTPKPGDRIKHTVGSFKQVWEVMPEDPFDPSDHLGNRLRIHARRIADEAA